jgi:hypothetical protein
MWSCRWSQDIGDSFTSKIRIYDAGEYVGFLYGEEWNKWRCWKVLKRTEEAGIVEELTEMPEGWAPFRVFSEEEYEAQILLDEPGALEFRIPGWKITSQRPLSQWQYQPDPVPAYTYSTAGKEALKKEEEGAKPVRQLPQQKSGAARQAPAPRHDRAPSSKNTGPQRPFQNRRTETWRKSLQPSLSQSS